MPIVKSVFVFAWFLSSIMMVPTFAQAELYIAGQVGGAFPGDLVDAKGTGKSSGLTFGDFEMTSSIVYGGKLGYFLEGYNWLGFEVDAFTTTPHIKQQTVQVRPAGIINQRDVELRVTTVALNLVFRYPGKTLQPYIGGGPGYFHVSGTSGASDSDSGIGLNFIAGLRVFLIPHLALFGEYKYFAATFEFDNAFGPGFGIEEDYSANHFLGGISYHF